MENGIGKLFVYKSSMNLSVAFFFEIGIIPAIATALFLNERIYF